MDDRFPEVCFLLDRENTKGNQHNHGERKLQYPQNHSRIPATMLMLARTPKVLQNQNKNHFVVTSLLDYFITRSYCSPFTDPPLIEDRTFLLKPSLLILRSSAASLLSGSEAFGSRKRNYCMTSMSANTPVQISLDVFRESLYAGFLGNIPRFCQPTCNPTMTAFKFRTGFQSSLKMFKHTLPSRSMFGWYIFCVHLTFGGSCGYDGLTAKLK